jgi:uncharacterized membrane protein YraQ (UPF0718 family)
MLLPIAIALSSHVAGALLGLGGGRRSLAALRTFALVSALAVVLAQLLPDALGAAGLGALAVFAVAAASPALIGRIAARLGKNAGVVGLELGYTGLLLHHVADGLAIGAYAGEHHHDHHHGDVLAALSAHTVPLVALVALAYQRHSGTRAAVLRVGGLLAATVAGSLATTLVSPEEFGRFEPWVTAAVAGLLLHVLAHDWGADGAARPGVGARLVDLCAVAAGIALVVFGGHEHHASGDVRSRIGASLWELWLDTAPPLLIGLVVGALLSARNWEPVPVRWLRGGPLREAVVGAWLGLQAPMRACGVVPLAEALRSRGGGPALVVAFTMVAPQLSIESFVLTQRMLGWPFAVVRLGAVLLLAVVAALALSRASRVGGEGEGSSMELLVTSPQGSYWRRLLASFDAQLAHVAPWMVVGLVAAAYVQEMVDDGALAPMRGYGLDVLVVTFLAVPGYVCAPAATPLAAVLLAKGMSPGAVLAGLLLGPGLTLARLGFLRARYGGRAAMGTVVAAIVGAWVIALAAEHSDVASSPRALVSFGVHEHGWATYLGVVALAALAIRSLWRVGLRRWLASLGDPLGRHEHVGHAHEHHDHCSA